MLAAVGVDSIDELFADVPAGVRLGRPIDMPAGKPEQEVYGYLRELAARNVSADDEISFLGAGMYDHYVPAIIDSRPPRRSRRPAGSRSCTTGAAASSSRAGCTRTRARRSRRRAPAGARRSTSCRLPTA